MSDYSRVHDFSAKDALSTGDALKVIKGSEVDAELDAVVTAVATKIEFEKGSDIASSNTVVVGTDGNYFDITGTTQINVFTVAVNRRFTLQFDGILILQHHATNLDLPSLANITTAAGDVAEFFSHTANQVQCVNYTKADGTAVVASAGGGPSVGTNAIIRTNAANIQENITLSDHLVTFTATNGTNIIANRGSNDDFVDGDMVQLTGSDLPNGWLIDTQYFVRDITSSTMKLALTFGGTAVTISDDGSGTNKIYQNINGMTAGPVTISEDTVTIPSGSTWSII
jgi:hypothetical protein